MPHPRFSSEEIAEKGQALYDRGIRDKLGPDDRGKYLVLDIETGHYELDTDQLAAVKLARSKQPEAAFLVLRVGHHSLGG